MRIILVSWFMVEYGVELANAISKKTPVHLVLCQKRISETFGDQLHDRLAPNVTLTILPFQSTRHPSTIRCAAIIIKLLLKFRPQIIHAQEFVNPMLFLFLLFKSCPIVTTVHDVELHPGTQKEAISNKIMWIAKSLREHFYTAVIVHGNMLKELFLNRFNRAEKDIHVIPHGPLFSFDSGKPPAAEEEPHTILFFGRMQTYKGLKQLIETEPLISAHVKDLKILVAGQGEDMDIYKEQMIHNSHFEVHDRFIPNDEVAVFFQRASVVVLPYIEASQSGISAMAFAFKKPVIATDVGSLKEMVINGRTGIIVPPNDARALAKAVVDMLDSKATRAGMARNIQNDLETHFNWDCIADETIKAYQSVITSVRSKGCTYE